MNYNKALFLIVKYAFFEGPLSFMLTYDQIQDEPKTFKYLTGFSPQEFPDITNRLSITLYVAVVYRLYQVNLS
jgi:hypothetical protein